MKPCDVGCGVLLLLLAGCDSSATHAPLVVFREGEPVTGLTPHDSAPPDVALSDGSAANDGASDASIHSDANVVVDAGTGPNALTVVYRTHSQGGGFAPRNIGAAWIERGDGTWIKTLQVWAAIRARYLSRFNAASGGNRLDAISSATLASHVRHENHWDLRDVQGNRVAPGAYRVVIELTDGNRAGASIELPFTLDATWMETTPFPATAFYSDLVVSLR